MTLYANDPDANVVYPITDAQGGTLDFPAVVQVTGQPDITGQWLGDPGPTRDLKVPLAGLPAGSLHRLRLVIPGDNDVSLGQVRLV